MNKLLTLGVCFSLTACSSITPLKKKQDRTPDQISAKPMDITPSTEARTEIKTARRGTSRTVRSTREQIKTAPRNQILGTANIDSEKKSKGNVYFLYGAEHLKLENYYFDIPVVYNAKVKKWMNYFLNRGKGFFQRYTERSGRYAPILGKILEDYGLPRDLIFLAMAESGFHNKAKSWAKAVGPWQFMPFTGKRYGLKINWYVDERRDPIKATIAAAKYLKDLYANFGSWELAAAGYNAGEGKVARAIRRYKTANFWKISKGRYLKSETKNYVPKIMALAIIGKNLKSFGFGDVEFNDPLDFDEIEVPANTDLFKIAEATDVPFEEIHRLNPEIMRWVTPPAGGNYKLRMPVGFSLVWNTCCKEKNFYATDHQNYKMRSNSSLRAVSRKFKVPEKVLADLNGFYVGKKMRRGHELKLPFRNGQTKRENMYADLYEKPRKSVRRWRSYKARIKRAMRRGRKIASPKQFYKVKKGDTLWRISKKVGVSMDTIIRSNYRLVKSRMIRVGDKLVVR